MLTRKAVILAKIESTYGTDPVPTAASDAMLSSVPEVEVDGEKITRDYVRQSLSPLGHAIGLKSVIIKFSTELKGSGSAGVAPEIGPLFRACGLDETTVASTSVEYDPVSEDFESVTLYFYRDGVLHKALGCRGTFEIDMSVGQFGVLNWTFHGIYAAPSDQALVTGSYNATQPPSFLDANLTLGAYGPVFTSLKINLNNTISPRKNANSVTGLIAQEITDREPNGSLDPEATTLATKDFWTAWANGTKESLSAQAGGTAGNICTITAPALQYSAVKYGDREGVVVYDTPFTCCLVNGDDELKLKFT